MREHPRSPRGYFRTQKCHCVSTGVSSPLETLPGALDWQWHVVRSVRAEALVPGHPALGLEKPGWARAGLEPDRPSPGTVFRTLETSGKLKPRPSPSLRWPERSWTNRRVRQEEGARVVRTSRLRTGTRTERSPGTSPGPAGSTDPTLSSLPHSEVLHRLSPDTLSYWRREGRARLSPLSIGCPSPEVRRRSLGAFGLHQLVPSRPRGSSAAFARVPVHFWPASALLVPSPPLLRSVFSSCLADVRGEGQEPFREDGRRGEAGEWGGKPGWGSFGAQRPYPAGPRGAEEPAEDGGAPGRVRAPSGPESSVSKAGRSLAGHPPLHPLCSCGTGTLSFVQNDTSN